MSAAKIVRSSLSQGLATIRCPKCGHVSTYRDVSTTKGHMAAKFEAADHKCKGAKK